MWLHKSVTVGRLDSWCCRPLILFQCRSIVAYDDVTKPLLVNDLEKLRKRSQCVDVEPSSGKHKDCVLCCICMYLSTLHNTWDLNVTGQCDYCMKLGPSPLQPPITKLSSWSSPSRHRHMPQWQYVSCWGWTHLPATNRPSTVSPCHNYHRQQQLQK